MISAEDQCYYESFNSFLAGVFLTNRKISNFEFYNAMKRFEKIYDVIVIGADDDIDLSVCLDDNNISLVNDYNDIIIVNDIKIRIEDYLYSFASPRVREFFNIYIREEKLDRNDNFAQKMSKKKFKTKACW